MFHCFCNTEYRRMLQYMQECFFHGCLSHFKTFGIKKEDFSLVRIELQLLETFGIKKEDFSLARIELQLLETFGIKKEDFLLARLKLQLLETFLHYNWPESQLYQELTLNSIGKPINSLQYYLDNGLNLSYSCN